MGRPDAQIAKLLQRIKEGDRAARKELFAVLGNERQLGKVLQIMARKMLGKSNSLRRTMDTEDLVHSALRTGLRRISNFRGESEEQLLAWLGTILRTKLHRVIRRPDPRPAGSIRQKSSAPLLSELIDQESIDLLRNAITRLPVRLRVVVEMRLWGYNAKKIGELLDIKPDTVRKRESRAVKALREEVAGSDSTLFSP